MSFRLLKYLFIPLLVLVCEVLPAQDLYRAGVLPAFNVRKSLPGGFSANFKAESRQGLLKGEFGGEQHWEYDYILTDLSLVASKKIGLNNSIAAGYLIRLRENLTIHRIIQQFTMVQKFRGFRAAHRFAADESFASGLSMELRLRYRFTADIPFNGLEVDPGEFYLKVSNEYLNAFYEDEYGLEIRLSPLFGYVFTDNNKLEFGPDYRISSVFEKASVSSFWLSISWYLRL